MPVIEDPQIRTIRVLNIGVSTSVSNIIPVGAFARFVALTNPNGIALEVLDTGTDTWIEQWRYTEP